MSSSLDYLDLCRLCLVKDRVSVPIFEDEGDVRQIFLKIAACLPVKIAKEDKLPKKICDDCVYKVELLYQFWNTTSNAEKQLLQWLGEVGSLEDKQQGYTTEVHDSNVMKQEQSSDNRLDGSVLQVRGHQNNMNISMMDNMTLIAMPAGSEQQFTSVPMDTSSSVQTVQAVPGSSTHDQIVENQTAVSHLEHEVESEEDENSDDGCDNDQALPVKEETEEDPNDQSLEPTTFVNVPIACDEAGPSGLQQQKISDMSEMAMQSSNDVDPKTGETSQTPMITANVAQKMPTIDITKKMYPMVKIDLSKLNAKICKAESAPLIVSDPEKIKSMLQNLDRMIVLNSDKTQTPTSILPEVQVETLPEVQNIKVENIKQEVKVEADDEDPDFEYVDESDVECLDDFESVPENSSYDDNASQCDSCEEQFTENSALIIHKTEQSIKRSRAILRTNIVKCNGNMPMPQGEDETVDATEYENRDTIPQRRIVKPPKPADDQPVSCTKCDRVFKRMKYLKVHMANVHGKQIRCEVCQCRFENLLLLREHMEAVHDGYFVVFCSICHKGFRLSQSIKIHMAAHARDDNLCMCEICGRAFRHEVYLRKHVQSIHVEQNDEKKFQCEYCQYSTQHKSRFTEHMCKHTGKGLAQCEYCLKYVRKGTLKIHRRIHTGERPEICEYCGRSFSARKYLTKHLVTHTGEKPFQCQICNKSYTQRGTLTLHFRRHHSEDSANSARNRKIAARLAAAVAAAEKKAAAAAIAGDDGAEEMTEDDGAEGMTEDDGVEGATEDDGACDKDDDDDDDSGEDNDEDYPMGNDEEYAEAYEEATGQSFMGTEILEEEGVVTYDDIELFQDGILSQNVIVEESVTEEQLLG